MSWPALVWPTRSAAPRRALQLTNRCDPLSRWTEQGDDAAMMKLIDRANVACGSHAGDWDVMDATVKLAQANGVQVGAHASFPGELQGQIPSAARGE